MSLLTCACYGRPCISAGGDAHPCAGNVSVHGSKSISPTHQLSADGRSAVIWARIRETLSEFRICSCIFVSSCPLTGKGMLRCGTSSVQHGLHCALAWTASTSLVALSAITQQPAWHRMVSRRVAHQHATVLAKTPTAFVHELLANTHRFLHCIAAAVRTARARMAHEYGEPCPQPAEPAGGQLSHTHLPNKPALMHMFRLCVAVPGTCQQLLHSAWARKQPC
jgi:hypothetical protein